VPRRIFTLQKTTMTGAMMSITDPTALLATEASFLAEDRDHVVVALKLRKDTLRTEAPVLWAALQREGVEAQDLFQPTSGHA
jgi:hypothetical protein